MSERPILFSAPMVRAILSGAKTQTRRVVNMNSPAPIRHIGPRGSENDPSEWGYHFDDKGGSGYCVLGRGHCEPEDGGRWSLRCPYGAPGDRLWVRETWAYDLNVDREPTPEMLAWVAKQRPPRVWYRASHPAAQTGCGGAAGRWRPSIHMPRWASRLTLRVTDVRVERVKAITEADAVAEGVDVDDYITARGTFVELWDSINGKRPGATWKDNPWVWVVAFEAEQ